MPNIRLLPPNGAASTIQVNSRNYSCAANATIDVPDFDAFIMMAAGWVNVAGASASAVAAVGATSARPANPKPNQTFHDTTLNMTIIYEGKAWRNPATGAAV